MSIRLRIIDADYTLTIIFTDGTAYTTPALKGAKGDEPLITAEKQGKTTIVKADGTEIARILDGDDGNDGHSPVVTATKADGVTQVKVDGSEIAQISDGDDYTLTQADRQEIARLVGTDATLTDPDKAANAKAVGDALSSQNEDIAELQPLLPETAPSAVGKVLKVLSVNDDGTFTCEWADAPASGVSDVKVNNTSVVTDGVANIPKGKNGVYGVITPVGAYGMETYGDGNLGCARMTLGIFQNRRWNDIRPITSGYFDHILRDALSHGTNTVVDQQSGQYVDRPWTVSEQAAACLLIGAEKAKGEWALVGTIAGTAEDRGNIDTGVNVDLTGCTEFVVLSSITGTGNSNFTVNGGFTVLSQIAINGTRSTYSRFVNEFDSLFAVVYQYGSNLNSTLAGNGTRYFYPFNNSRLRVEQVTLFKFTSPSFVASCDIKIYAR